MKKLLEKLFKLKSHNTNIKTEILAGITTFMTMSYIIFVNPTILSMTGMDYNAVYAATILTSIIGTLFMAFYANVPYVQSAGLGLNAIFTYTLCQGMGYTWQQALALVFFCGLINIIVTATSIREKIVKSIPGWMQDAISVGIGLFITYVGLKSAGLLEFSVSNVTNGVAPGADVVPALVTFNKASAILAIIGIFITVILLLKKVKTAYLLGIVITTIIGIPLGVTKIPDFSNMTFIPSLKPTFLQLDIVGLFTHKTGILVVLMTLFSLCLSDLFDTIGIFVGTCKKSGIFKIGPHGEIPENMERAMLADSVATSVGALLGTSNVTTYLESSAGIEAGGRTGLTSLTAAICFFLSLILAPLVACVPMSAIAPVLIIVGLFMIENVVHIDWKDLCIAIPSFFIMIMMPLAYSITIGIELGFIFYALVNIVTGRSKEVPRIVYLFAILFIITFIYQAL